ncbi:hypothetical protein BCD64_14320 [Nostoc sp. MBR 210]|nr:hypothetical protein BCD64_14320 [Nostoc sp. MBR 210]
MNLEKSQNRIRELMLRFRDWIKTGIAMDKTDSNKVAETIFIPLFSEIYGYKHLENLNYTKRKNYKGIDLGDETARVAFQITSTSNNKKIKDTLNKFVEDELYKRYDKLIIYILTEKQDNYTGSGHQEIIQGKFNFDKDKDIRDYRDILKEVANFQIEKARRIESILEANFGENRKAPGWGIVDKVEQIIQEYIQFFVGRSEEVKTLDKFLSENSSGFRLLISGAGFGKTALLANWVKLRQNKEYFIAYHFFSQRYNVTRSVEDAYRHLLQQLYTYYEELRYQQVPNDEKELWHTIYDILREYAALKDKPLVIVIDSLDEAENPFEPPFPTPLPENVFVIASARAEEGEKPEYLDAWIDNGEVIPLSRLPSEAIADWLKQAGEGELAIFADDIHFVKQLDEITQGFPLYLKYLIEDLSYTAKQGKDIGEVLAQTPKGFEQYIKQQRQLLDKLELPDQRWQFFALLAVAKGTLEKEDVKEITGMRDRHLRQLQQCWQVTRWMKIAEDKLYGFAHPLLGKTFANELGDDAEDALEDLINYCSCWHKNQSFYALRHYAEHLRDKKQWEDLYAIARNKAFASCQQENLPDEPDLLLKTIQIALLGAAEEDKAGEMAEFLLIHAQQLVETTSQESPLDALRKGSLNRALAMADLYEIERCALWYLLLAWELKDTGKLKEAIATLERLQQKEIPRFDIQGDADWLCDFAAYFLAQNFEISDSICGIIEQKLLNDRYRRLLSIYLSDFNHFVAAIDTTLKISSNVQEKIWQLASIAKAQAQKGDITAAATFDKALEITRRHFPSHDWFDAMIMIGETQGKVGYQDAMLATFTEAYNSATKISNSSDTNPQLENLERKIEAIKTGGNFSKSTIEDNEEIENEANRDDELIKIKNRLDEAVHAESDKNEILFRIAVLHSDKQQYDEALDYAARINNSDRRATVQGIIAQEQAKSGQNLAARTTFATALQMAKVHEQYELAFLQARTLAGIAEVQIKALSKQEATNTISIAHQIALTIHNFWQRSTALARVAEMLAQVEKEDDAKKIFEQAIQTAHKITKEWEHIQSFKFIALAQARVKYFASACKTAQSIKSYSTSTKSQVLETIARLQEKSGQREEALNTLFSASQNLPYISDVQSFIEGKPINIICTEVVLESLIDYETAQVRINNLLRLARESGNRRDVNLVSIVAAFAEMGDMPTALKITDEIEDSWQRMRAFWMIAKEQYNKQEKVTTLEASLKTKDKIDDQQQRMESLKIIAAIQVLAGFGEKALRTNEAILTDRNRQLPQIASLLVQTGDYPNFKKMLIPCAYYLDSAYEVCEYLAQLYPEQAATVAKVIILMS